MDTLKEMFRKEITKRILVLIIISILFYLLRGFLDLFLLTFLFTYLLYSMEKAAVCWLSKYIKVKGLVITIILYATLFISIVFFIYKYIPIVINQCINIINEVSEFSGSSFTSNIGTYISPILNQVDLKGISKSGANYLLQFATDIGKWSINIFLALILSLFFMLEREKVKRFMSKFENSRIKGFYYYLKYFARNFLNSFGKVMQAQILIALINSVLSVILLSFMHFPQLLGLGVMIFILGLIPVAGVILSLVPLAIIAYNIGGLIKILYVIIMVVVLHALESYVLNPKFMSAKTELPVFFVFLILIISKHFMGFWGLLIGVPLFMFLLDLIYEKPNNA